MRSGYAAAATDTGHSNVTEPGGTFAADRQKLLDYAFRSLHVSADGAKMILAPTTAALKSYCEGCFTGGRKALKGNQRLC